jgi:hypothetical protein
MVFLDVNFPKKCPDTIPNFNGKGGVYAPSLHKTENTHLKGINYFKAGNKLAANLNGDGIYTANNCGTAATALAIALGYTEIYLLGIDLGFSKDRKETHFHGGYGNEGMSMKTYSHMAAGFWRLGEWVRDHRPDVKLYNCSTHSLLNLDEFIADEGQSIQFSKLYPYKSISGALRA